MLHICYFPIGHSRAGGQHPLSSMSRNIIEVTTLEHVLPDSDYPRSTQRGLRVKKWNNLQTERMAHARLGHAWPWGSRADCPRKQTLSLEAGSSSTQRLIPGVHFAGQEKGDIVVVNHEYGRGRMSLIMLKTAEHNGTRNTVPCCSKH
jgi:hypothetical protein